MINKVEYEAHLKTHGIKEALKQPLGKFLYNRTWVASIADGASWVQSRQLIEDVGVPDWMHELGVKGLGQSSRTDFGMMIAVSGNSVKTEFNPNPVNPRILTVNDLEMEQLLEMWKNTCCNGDFKFYDPPRNVQNSILLESMNLRKVSLSLEFNSAALQATRQGLLSRMKKSAELVFISYIF